MQVSNGSDKFQSLRMENPSGSFESGTLVELIAYPTTWSDQRGIWCQIKSSQTVSVDDSSVEPDSYGAFTSLKFDTAYDQDNGKVQSLLWNSKSSQNFGLNVKVLL